jgi:hypothetical protein
MFRPELADLSACPSAGAAGSRAYSVLLRLVDQNFRGPRVGPDRLEAITTMHWSMVHGLSTLLLDGSLGRRMRSARDTEALIDRTLDLFSRTAGRQR